MTFLVDETLRYRLYFVNTRGQVLRAMDIQAENDEAAVVVAAPYADRNRVELWQGARRVFGIDEGAT